MVDPAALREALDGPDARWNPDSPVIVAAARELLRRMETAETVWWCEDTIIDNDGRWYHDGTTHTFCRMVERSLVEAVLTRRDTCDCGWVGIENHDTPRHRLLVERAARMDREGNDGALR